MWLCAPHRFSPICAEALSFRSRNFLLICGRYITLETVSKWIRDYSETQLKAGLRMYSDIPKARFHFFSAVNYWRTPGRTIVIKSTVYIVGVAFIAILLFVSSRVLPHPIEEQSPNELVSEIHSESKHQR